jgi:hypothetical protein
MLINDATPGAWSNGAVMDALQKSRRDIHNIEDAIENIIVMDIAGTSALNHVAEDVLSQG